METNYIESQAARVNRNLLLVNGSVLGLMLVFIAFMLVGGAMLANLHERGQAQADAALQDATAIYHQPAGLDLSHPARIGASDVASPERLKQWEGHAVILTDPQAQNLMFPVWDWMGRATGKVKPHSPTFYHVSGAQQGHLFLILPGSPNAGTTFTGVIRPLTKADYNAVHPVLMGRGLPEPAPYLLDGLNLEGSAENPAAVASMNQARSLGQRRGLNVSPAALLFFGLAIGLSGWNVFKAISRIKNPLTHPLYAKLGRYGTPLDVSRAIDAERQVGVVGIGPAEFTRSWLLFPSLFTLDAVPLDEIAWAYQMVTLYNFIPVSFRMVLYDRAGRNHPISAGSGSVTQILEYIGKVRPGALLGYDRRLRDRFFSDRAAVLAEIDARRSRNVP